MKRRAFTVVELLMVLGIIVVLIGLIFVAMRGVQSSAARTESVNSLRQMVAGYISYSTDNRNRLMPGYVDYENPKATTPQLNAKFASGEWIVPLTAPNSDRENLSSYVWRFAPYIDHNWRTLMTDYRDRAIVSAFVAQIDGDPPIYGPADESDPDVPTVAATPSFGLNSIFLGGDDRHGGPEIAGRSPWVSPADKIAATRMSEVLAPSNVIVFAPAGKLHVAWNPAMPSLSHVYITPSRFFNQPAGYPELRPPFLEKDSTGEWLEHQWLFGQPAAGGGLPNLIPGPDIAATSEIGAGLPIMRHGREHLPVAMLDGSARVDSIHDVAYDMRRWSPFETGTALSPVP